MFEHPDSSRPDTWRVQRMVKLRQMASELRVAAGRRPATVANTFRQLAVDLERSANRMETDVIVPPA
jgi:hypothetical protein